MSLFFGKFVTHHQEIIYLGQNVVNLGIHQSSSVSMLSYTKNLSTDLYITQGVGGITQLGRRCSCESTSQC